MNATIPCENCGVDVLLDDRPIGTVTRIEKGIATLHGKCKVCGKEFVFMFNLRSKK